MKCAFNLKDFRVIPLTDEVEKNKNYAVISMKLAMALDAGIVKGSAVQKAVLAELDTDTLLPVAKVEVPAPVVAPVVEVPSPFAGESDAPTTFEEVEAMSIRALKEYAKTINAQVKSGDAKDDIVVTVAKALGIAIPEMEV